MLTRRSLDWVWVQLVQGVPFDDERPSGRDVENERESRGAGERG